MLGQDHVVRALTGAIREGRLHHAFLFCGPRGTGKTSTARILAKMVNCENGPTAEPCGVCTQCVAIREGQHLDVVEIDAASHGGVEDARELREGAPTAPAMGREKVYIIDEAQRLSREAFDALLKVFEEPPSGVRFVLATTEPHKMPATIVGRCQRFDFRRLTMETLADAAAEDRRVRGRDHHRLRRARDRPAGRGLVPRRALAAGSGERDGRRRRSTTTWSRSLLGAPRGEVQHELADAVAVGDARTAFEIVNRLVQDGQDLRNVTAEALAHFRNLLLVKTAPGQEDLLDIPADGYEQLRIQAEKFTPAELARVIALLLAAQNDMRWTTSPRLSLELALVRATIPRPIRTRRRRRPPRTPRTPRQPRRGLAVRRGAGGRHVGHGDYPVLAPSELRSSGSPLPTHRPPSQSGGGRRRHICGGRGSRGPTLSSGAAKRRAAPTEPRRPPTVAADLTAEGVQMQVHAADAGSVDVAMLRRSWPSLLEHLQSTRQMILRASSRARRWRPTTGRRSSSRSRRETFTVEKVMGKTDELQPALGDLFGVRPAITCVVREARDNAEEPTLLEIVDDEDRRRRGGAPARAGDARRAGHGPDVRAGD